jgi:hypothetical protein
MSGRMQGLGIGLILVLTGACSPPAEEFTAVDRGSAVMMPVDRAIAVARAIQAAPAAADSILEAHGLTRAGLDSLLYAIAADSTLARAYTEAMR